MLQLCHFKAHGQQFVDFEVLLEVLACGAYNRGQGLTIFTPLRSRQLGVVNRPGPGAGRSKHC